MDNEHELSELLGDKMQYLAEALRRKVRAHLMALGKEERYVVMRRDLTSRQVEELCEWALPEEEYEICATMKEVLASDICTFKVRFTYNETDNNKAIITKFIDTDGITYYHADYLLDDDDDGTMVMLHKTEAGDWVSEWQSCDETLFQPIGEAIDAKENSGSSY